MFLLALMTLMVSACKKLDLAPVNKFTDSNFWTTTDKASSVLNTAYSQMFRDDYFFYNEGMSDNAYNSRGDVDGVESIASGTYDASLGRFKDEWDYHYAGIKTCNIFLENVDRVTTMDATLKARMKAEARFMRAFHYFQLATWYGDVPLFDTDISIADSKSISRTPYATVIAFVLKELDAAASALPVNTAYAAADHGRITKGAAIGMKARVYLYNSDWANVATTCQQLMTDNSNGTYALFPDYQGIFLPQNEYNSEVLLDLEYVPLIRTYSDFFDFAPLAVGARLNDFAPTQELVDNYLMLNGSKITDAGSGYDETNPYVNRDPRLTGTVVYNQYQWLKPDGTYQEIYTKPGSDPNQSSKIDEYATGKVSSPTGYYTRKYYDPTSAVSFQSGLNLIMLRYADILLMDAEAQNELGQLNEATWDKTIKLIRARAGFTTDAALNFGGGDQAALRDIIRAERRSEMAMEGLRVFDIRRWKTSEIVLNGWAHGAQFGPLSIDNGYIRANLRSFDKSKAYLWPVPRDERAADPGLSQNPGY